MAVPIKVGLSLGNYYEVAGVDETFGFLSVGGIVTVPLGSASRYGSWNIHGGAEYQKLGDEHRVLQRRGSSPRDRLDRARLRVLVARTKNVGFWMDTTFLSYWTDWPSNLLNTRMRRARLDGPTGELTAVAELGRVLAAATNLRGALARVVEHLEDLVGATSVGVWIKDEADEELRVVAATGVAWQGQQRARYRLGEGITLRVVQTGRPVIVPHVSREPLFANRAGPRPRAGRESSFISVPVPVGGRTQGALGVMLPYRADVSLAHTCELLVVAGTMVGQAVRVERLVQSERQRLQQENTQLRQELKERYDFRNIVGTSRPMQTLYEQMSQVAGAYDHRADSRRVGHRQGADRARAALPLAARQQAVREGELRRAAGGTGRVGAVRLRARRVHRRQGHQEGQVRAGQRRHAVPRRSGRAHARHAGQAAARAAGARDRTPGRHPADQGERAPDCGDQQRPRNGDPRPDVPRRSLLPPERLQRLRAAAARAQVGHPAAGRSLRREIRPPPRARKSGASRRRRST